MGARLSLELLLTRPERFSSVILGGFVLEDPPPPGTEDSRTRRSSAIVEALLADSLEQVTDPTGQMFRSFAESTGGNLKALAAVMKGSVENRVPELVDPAVMRERIRSINIPLLTIVGDNDFLPGDKSGLAMLVPKGCHFLIQGKDHLSTVYARTFRMIVKTFLNYANGQEGWIFGRTS